MEIWRAVFDARWGNKTVVGLSLVGLSELIFQIILGISATPLPLEVVTCGTVGQAYGGFVNALFQAG